MAKGLKARYEEYRGRNVEEVSSPSSPAAIRPQTAPESHQPTRRHSVKGERQNSEGSVPNPPPEDSESSYSRSSQRSGVRTLSSRLSQKSLSKASKDLFVRRHDTKWPGPRREYKRLQLERSPSPSGPPCVGEGGKSSQEGMREDHQHQQKQPVKPALSKDAPTIDSSPPLFPTPPTNQPPKNWSRKSPPAEDLSPKSLPPSHGPRGALPAIPADAQLRSDTMKMHPAQESLGIICGAIASKEEWTPIHIELIKLCARVIELMLAPAPLSQLNWTYALVSSFTGLLEDILGLKRAYRA